MICPVCKSQNVNVQVSTETKLKTKHHSVLYWLLIGWWWAIIKWVVFTIPALIIAIFRPKRYQLKQKDYSVCVCQNCGHQWRP